MEFLLQDSSLALVRRIFGVIFPLTAIAAVGFFYARRRPTDMAIANRLNIDVFAPALIFAVMVSSEFSIGEYGMLGLGAAGVILGSGLVVLPLCRWFGIQWRTLLPPMMFNNSGNLGIPLLVLAFGEAALPAAVMMFVVSNLLNFTVGIYMLDQHSNPLLTFRKPVVLSAVLGLIWSHWQLPLPEPVFVSIDMLGQIAVPLMLFSLGVRMTDVDFSHWRLGILAAIASPLSGLIMVLVMQPFLGLGATQLGYLILFAALPPAVLNYMLAEKYGQQPASVATMVLVGNLGGLLFIPLALAFIL